AFLRAATEMVRDGTFTFTQAAVPGRDINRWFAAPDNSPVLFGE
ncbi:isocitrate lyase/phosphoenolpyruvate mutase family protein, partial [Escherichia coli]|nr:isocitrate lyase/phosphoenolpyruvate mutase family protein [Escherichia coli]